MSLNQPVVRAGVLALLAPAIIPWSSSASASASPRTCAARPRAVGAPALTVAPAGKPVLRGRIHVQAGRSGWTVKAPLGRFPSSVSAAFTASRQVSVEFCLSAPAGTTTRIVRLSPGDISVRLSHGRLALQVPGAVRVFHAVHRASVTARGTFVELLVDEHASTVTLIADGARQDVYRGTPPRQRVVQVGSLTTQPHPPAAPGTHGGSTTGSGSVTFSGVTVAAGSQQVIPPASQVPPQAATPWPGNPFSPSSFWNAPLSPSSAVDANSPAYVNELLRQIASYGLWMNTTEYSVPVYVVPSDEPTQPVALGSWAPDLQAEFDAVPIPANAEPAAGTDKHMVVWQPATDKMWEFWVMEKQPDGWHARWGGEMDHVSSSPGFFTHQGQTKDWGATATGLPLLGGLVTFADLQRGYINHALALSLVETARAYWSWPAQRTDGGVFTKGIATPIPEGTRFRLDPDLDLAALNLPPIDRMLAQAAQTYGIVVRDKGGAVALYGEDPGSDPGAGAFGLTSPNPWHAAFDNQYFNTVLARFPWSHLVALQSDSDCCWGP